MNDKEDAERMKIREQLEELGMDMGDPKGAFRFEGLAQTSFGELSVTICGPYDFNLELPNLGSLYDVARLLERLR